MLRLTEHHLKRARDILSKEFLFIGLDYDGTLTPLVSHPDRAQLPQDVKSLLADLSVMPNTFVCIISGRSYEDVRRKVGIRNIIYAGNHGMEIKGRGLSFSVRNRKESVQEINKTCRNLRRRLKTLRGVWVENKGLSASIHYRLADSKDTKKVKPIISPIIESSKYLKLTKGKKVWEATPNIDWNKGKAVAYILDRCLTKVWRGKSTVVYIGDDLTDEHAFSFLGQDGITALVSKRPRRGSNARYFLTSPREAIIFLRWLANLWEDKGVKSKPAGKDTFRVL